MKKLTLSAEDGVVRDAKRLARCRKTSVSAMFSGFIRSLAGREKAKESVPEDSIAARATGFISLPAGKSEHEILTDALVEKYRIKR